MPAAGASGHRRAQTAARTKPPQDKGNTAAGVGAGASRAGKWDEPTAIAAREARATLANVGWETLAFAVTGANGYFGHRMVKSLLALGVRRLALLDRVHSRTWPQDRVDVFTVDVRDVKALTAALAGVDVIVHTASFFGAPPFGTIADSGEFAVNAQGTANVVQAAIAVGAAQLIYVSSSSAIVSGSEELVDVSEETPYPDRYLDFYGPAKAEGERVVLAADGAPSGKQRLLRTAVIRPSGIYAEDELLHIPRILRIVGHLAGWLPFYFGGHPLSDWTHVENLAWGVYLVAEHLTRPNGGRAAKQIFHITDGEAITYVDFFRPFVEACGGRVWSLMPLYLWMLLPLAALAEWVCWLLGRLPGVLQLKVQPPMTRLEAFKCCRTHTLSIAKAARELGYRPLVTMAEGMAHAAADVARKRVGSGSGSSGANK